jgi:hypothetical protein
MIDKYFGRRIVFIAYSAFLRIFGRLKLSMPLFYRVLCVSISLLLISKGISAHPTIAGKEAKTAKESKEFRISNLRLDTINNKLLWTAFNQQGVMSFSVEQFLNEHWTLVGEVVGDSHSESSDYSYSPHFTSGENKYRISWMEADNKKNYSNIIVSATRKPEVLFHVTDDNLQIVFSETTFYMIYSPYGFIVTRGYGSKLDISEFKNGTYCVTYDNKVATFEKKSVWFSHSKHPMVRENKPEHFKRAKQPFDMTPP